MNISLRRFIHHRSIRTAWEAFSIAAPVAFWLWLAYRQIVDQLHTLNPVPILVASESLLAGYLLLNRRDDLSKAHSWYLKAATIFAAFLGPLLIEQQMPTGQTGFWLVSATSALGLLLAIWALASLGTSFGIAPADRGLVRRGPYRFIRHPMYMGAFLNVVAVVFANLTVWNALMLFLIILIDGYRIYLEERTVSGYEAYAREIPWRLIPGIF